MAAALTVTPAEIQVGDDVVVVGTGFLPSTKVTLTVLETGEAMEVNTDVAGEFGNRPIAAKAVGTLTSDATNVSAAETVTIDGVVYTFRAAPTTVANEVKVGADAATSLANLKKAINLSGVAGTDYGSATVVHPTVGAGVITATTLAVYAKTGGTAGNSLGTTETSAHLSWGGATLAGGAAATGNAPMIFKPQVDQPFDLSATDGTNTATAHVIVSTE